jgi:hypothetical protein
MTNRVRYYITENDDRPIVRSVPVTVSTQPVHQLMSIDKQPEPDGAERASLRRPVGRIVKVLRKSHNSPRS